MVDDGSYEANIFFYDQIVVNLLRISKEILIAIYTKLGNSWYV